MEFIVDNIVWFIVGGVVILMTIVGYLAEKTDFASKKYHKNIEQKKEKSVIEEKTVEPDSTVLENQDKIIEDKVQEEILAPLESIKGDNKQIEDIPSELFVPIEKTDLETNASIGVNNQLENMSKTEKISNSDTQSINDLKIDNIRNLDLDNETKKNTATEMDTLEESIEDIPIEFDAINNEKEEPIEQLKVDSISNDLNSFIEPVSSSLEQLEPIKPTDDKNSIVKENNNKSQLYDPSLSFDKFESADSLQKIDDNGYVNEVLSETLPEENVIEINNNNENSDVISAESLIPTESNNEISNEEADKIFPDDPVIINENNITKENVYKTNADVLEKMPNLDLNSPKDEKLEVKNGDSNPEDLWKF